MKLFKIADSIGNLSTHNKMLLGYVCLRCGELDDARKHLNLCKGMMRRDSKERFQIKNLLALVSWKEGNLSEAIEELEEIVAADYKNTQIYQNLGILYNLSDDTDKALKFNLEAYEYNRDDLIICDNLADTYAIRGEYETSAKYYAEMMERQPKPHFPEAYYGYGKVLVALGKTEEGLALIKESLEKPFSYLSIRPKEEIEELYRSLGGK
jgi:tetratricopeptide (TPR) repeat protein